jgi:hypothetical protein
MAMTAAAKILTNTLPLAPDTLSINASLRAAG